MTSPTLRLGLTLQPSGIRTEHAIMTTDQGSGDRAERSSDVPSDPAEWLDQHGDALYRFARARVGRREAAEDLVQETLLAALRASDQFRGDSRTGTWLMAILRRKIADYYRRDRATSPTAEADLSGPRSRPVVRIFDEHGAWRNAPARWRNPLDSLEDDEFRQVFADCSSRLPPHLARAFLLREVEGIEVDRLRTVLGIGAANLRIRLHRARLLLRECLEIHWFGTGTDTPKRRP